jgi:DNA-binding transcriptional LysR family regulator
MQVSDRIGRQMKLHDLHVLMAVVQVGSMNKAAALLNTRQSAISRSIADLERTIGVQLLDRNPQGVKPTEYGRALLDGGAAIFDELRQAVKKIEFLADPTTGEVRIGCSAFLATSFVFAAVDRLSLRYPGIVLHVVPTQTDALHRGLSERKFDVAITQRFGPFADEQLGFETLYDDSFVVVAGVQNSWVRRRSIDLAELVNESWVLPPPDSSIASVFMGAFRNSGLAYPRAAVFTVPSAMGISLVTTGRFLTIIPASILRFPRRRSELKILPVKLPLARVPTGIATLKNRTLNPVVQLFIQYARQVAKARSHR